MSAEEFKRIRAALGLSLTELAVLLTRDRITLWRWSKGLHPIPNNAARAIRALASERSA
jgi:DNA-binding transcriptional regulator YiaG